MWQAAKKVPDASTDNRGDTTFVSPINGTPSLAVGDKGPKPPQPAAAAAVANQPTLLFPSSSERHPSPKSGIDGGDGRGAGAGGIESDKVVGKDAAEGGEAAARRQKDGASTTKISPSKKEFSGGDRQVYPVPFWNRTNRIAEGEDGGGVRGRQGKDGAEGDRSGVSSKRPREEERGEGRAEPARVPVKYQFRAGYTNAVRRPVRMRDLL